MRNLKIRGRVNLLTLGAMVGLLLVLGLSLMKLSSVMRADIADTTRKEVETAHSIVAHFHARERAGQMTREQAQSAALAAIGALRYGQDDYFWVNDMHPRMLMHPFKPELNGTDISGNTDADGVFMFREMVRVVRESGEGFVDYRWSKPGEEEPAPKISYVKGFAPWGWIVGSGVYVDQIEAAVFDAAVELGSIALLVVLGVGVLSWLISRSIVTPLTGLTTRMRGLADGDTASPIPSRERSDELGQMSQALEVFRENAVAKAKADAEKAKADADQKFVVETVSDKLSSVSKGDLTAEIKAEFPASYAALKANFNEALANLRDLIGTVMESAHNLRTGSSEIAQASEDLARRTESNAASLEETSAALTQIDGRIKATAEAAGRTVARADEAIATVSDGRSIADEAVQAMSRVRESAKGIDEVIEGVDKIAFQTRVLAMNAAVEAGRAGDAGRGFAVVADLVSALAMRAEEEAKRARDQLTVTQTDIVTAVEAVTKIDGALTDISSGVGEVHELLGNMAQDNQAQASAITQISAAVNQMDQSTQQNAAMVEETSAAARNLNGEVESLADKAAQFRIDEKGSGSPKPRAAKAPATGYVSPVKPLAASRANGSGALAAAGVDDWNHF